MNHKFPVVYRLLTGKLDLDFMNDEEGPSYVHSAMLLHRLHNDVVNLTHEAVLCGHLSVDSLELDFARTVYRACRNQLSMADPIRDAHHLQSTDILSYQRDETLLNYEMSAIFDGIPGCCVGKVPSRYSTGR